MLRRAKGSQRDHEWRLMEWVWQAIACSAPANLSFTTTEEIIRNPHYGRIDKEDMKTAMQLFLVFMGILIGFAFTVLGFATGFFYLIPPITKYITK